MENLSILSWNVQGELNITGYTFPKKRKAYLASHLYDILALQEIPEKELSYLTGLRGYHIAACDDNAILSAHPIINSKNLPFPNFNKNVDLGNFLRADIRIGRQILRLYNCHFAIFRVGMATRQKQLEHIIADCKNHAGPVIICGDLNVTVPKIGLNRSIITAWHQEPKQEMLLGGKFIEGDEREAFSQLANTHGFKEVLDLYTPTWSPFKSEVWELFKLKLDWFLTKNLIVSKAALGEYVSDHRPIIIECQI